MADLLLEIVEGPGAGRQIALDRDLIIGRSPDVDLVLDDAQASRRHARVTPAADGSAVVEDLGSANGTFINHSELVGPARLDRGDELLIGVTVIQARSPFEVAQQPSAMRVVPAALRDPPPPPPPEPEPVAQAAAPAPAPAAASAAAASSAAPGLVLDPRTPDYINPEAIAAHGQGERSPGLRELDRFLDVRVRRQAQLAPLALLMVIAIALSIYFATK